MRKLALILLFLFILIFPLNVKAQVLSEEGDRVILKFNTSSKAYKFSFFKKHNILTSENLKLNNTVVVKVPKGQAGKFSQIFKAERIIEYAEPDFIATSTLTTNDEYYLNQWALPKINAPQAWDKTQGSSSVKIAIVDTGIDQNHPDLGGKVIGRANFTNNPDIDNNGHGTHVAGIAAALTNNTIGVSGLGYDTSLLSAKVLDFSGSGYYSWISNGIIWSADNGAKVINLSLGGSSNSTTLGSAVNYAWSKGSVVVAAAGNNRSSNPIYPANLNNVLSVAATDINDQKANFSNYGTWIDVASPGVSILSTYKGSYAYLSGTSMATPLVSGLAALIFADNPALLNSQVVDKIKSSADKIAQTGRYWESGRINACSALDCNLSFATPSPSPTPIATPVITPTPTPVPTSSPTPTPIATPSPTPSPTPTPLVSPTPIPKPWWCIYIPNHSSCR